MAVMAACRGNPAPVTGTSPSADAPSITAPMKITDPYSLKIDPAAFSKTIDNPYFPMTHGTRTIYQANTPGGPQRTTTEVTRGT
jgi:hypothetical protein